MKQGVSQPSAARGSTANEVGRFMLRFQSYFGLIAIILISALLSPTRNGINVFLTPPNLLNIVRFASENGIIAVGMTLVILIGGIDLSVGAVLALCAVAAAASMMRMGLGTVPTIILTLSIGLGVGLINGLVTTRLSLQPFITTLAMLSVARGVASLWSGGYAIPLAFGLKPNDAPPSFKFLFAGQVTILGLEIPMQIFYLVGVGIVATWILKNTGFGRYIYAIGGNETAARLSGVNVNRVKVLVFGTCSLLAGLAGLLHVALVNQGSHIDGAGYELNAIAAVVIGGTLLSGGSGTVVGSIIGAIILSILDNILGLRNISSEWQLILKGIIIVLAVVIQRQEKIVRT
jgi:ribose transport system permease protein